MSTWLTILLVFAIVLVLFVFMLVSGMVADIHKRGEVHLKADEAVLNMACDLKDRLDSLDALVDSLNKFSKATADAIGILDERTGWMEQADRDIARMNGCNVENIDMTDAAGGFVNFMEGGENGES